MAEKSNKPSILLAISILALAASLSYFTFELSQFIHQVPDILANIQTTSEKIDPVLEEVNKISNLIPPILAEVSATRKQIPEILKEVKAVRETIPAILVEVDKTREQIPVILDELAAAREQIPSILISIDAVSTEMKAYHPLASEALLQVGEARKEVPVILNRVDGMIDKAKVAASDASSGIVTGALSGLISAPFRLVSDFGSSIMGLSGDEADEYTKEDIALIQKHGKDLVNKGKLNSSHNWKNFNTNQDFKITLKKIYSKNGQACRDLHLQAWSESELEFDKEINICLTDEGKWEYQ